MTSGVGAEMAKWSVLVDVKISSLLNYSGSTLNIEEKTREFTSSINEYFLKILTKLLNLIRKYR